MGRLITPEELQAVADELARRCDQASEDLTMRGLTSVETAALEATRDAYADACHRLGQVLLNAAA